jgi:D-alanyl-D-alanine carboxypeptidase
MARSFRLATLCVPGLLLLLLLVPSLEAAERRHDDKHVRPICSAQKPQKFLIRSSFIQHGALNAAAHERALRYRAEHYGNVEGLGLERYNREQAYSNAVSVRFMGLAVQIHKRVAPALACVERHIRKSCTGAGQRYVPRAIGGFRQTNTYRGGEISNHLFGIALDIDPDRNPCCGCVAPWPNHPACKGPRDSVFERAALPRCWIDGFEQFGFYWLGRDPDLRDTMHFEFLGNPDQLTP